MQRLQRNDARGACALLERLIARDGPQPRPVLLLATAKGQLGRHDEAKHLIEAQLERTPDRTDLLVQLGVIEQYREDHAAAEGALDRALALDPNLHRARLVKAELARLQGDSDRAMALLDSVRGPLGHDPAFASVYANTARGAGRAADGIDVVTTALSGNILPMHRRMLLLAQARLLDADRQYDKAIEAAGRAHSIVEQAGRQRYVASEVEAAFDETMKGWSARTVERAFKAPTVTRDTLFIVGMPRSGTSLIEQVLACGEGVFGGGELAILHQLDAKLAFDTGDTRTKGKAPITPRLRSPAPVTEELIAEARALWDGVMDPIGPGAQLVTDKQPTNFLHLGAAALIAPGARVVWCRRDPMDTCLSNFLQNFRGNLTFVDSLGSLGQYYRLHERLMEHWKRVLPTPILEVSYERFVHEQEAVTRELVEFAGRAWDDEHLRFYESERITWTSSAEQVRRPVYSSSVERWRRYGEGLAPLRQALDDHASPG